MKTNTLIQNKKRAFQNNETGSALVYILIAIALLAALTVSFMEPSSQQTSSQNTFKTVAGVQGQIDVIRSAIQECVLIYPNGDSTIPDNGAAGYQDDGYNRPYPLDPDNTHMDASYRAAVGNKNVAEIRCPGNNDGAADQHLKVFSGGAGKFLPPPPDLFEPWRYYNGPDGVFYWIETEKSDAFVTAALEKLDAKFSDCETDVIVANGAAVDLDSTGRAGASCNTDGTGDSTCFRVWMVTDNDDTDYGGAETTATSTYPDETACNTP